MIATLICFVLMLALQFATPFWWWIMAVPFVYGLWKSRSAWESARTGMISAGGLWLLMSLYQYGMDEQFVAARVGGMLGLPHGGLMIVLTTALAMMAAGVSASSGYLLSRVQRRREIG